MVIDEAEFRQLIFNLVNGHIEESKATIPESAFVLNEFVPGSLCYMLYADLLDAYTCLCERLGVEEWNDEHVEIIIANLRAIGRHVGLKMFEYGVFFARREEQLRIQKQAEALARQE